MARQRMIATPENPRGALVPFTSEEEAQADVDAKAWADGAFDRAIVRLRSERNTLLAETDWWASSDLVMSDERKAYRQALRDLPSGLDTEEKVKGATFPTNPG